MSNYSQQISDLKKELNNLASMVQNTVRDAADDATSNVVGFDRAEMKRMAADAGRNVRGYLTSKTRRANELRHDAEDTISSNPLRSVAIAVAGGLILGAFLNRK